MSLHEHVLSDEDRALLRRGVAALERMSGRAWTPVEVAVPPVGQFVLTWCRRNRSPRDIEIGVRQRVGDIANGGNERPDRNEVVWYLNNYQRSECDGVVAWMPLPEGP